jgi:uncharacterized membrane protein
VELNAEGETIRVYSSGRGPERLEAFSDGVFAIAITLLVLGIRIPSGPELDSTNALLAALASLWPGYLGYALSFVTVGIMWANHHNLFRHVRLVDHGLLVANLALLLAVGFVPFTTGLLTATLGEPTAQLGVLVYALSFVAIALGFNALWYAARRHGGRLLRDDSDPASIAAITRSYRLGPPGYVVAFVVALISPLLGMLVLIGLVLVYVLPSSSGA